MKLTYEMILANPELLSSVMAQARRERALAMNRMLFAPIANLFRRQPCPSYA